MMIVLSAMTVMAVTLAPQKSLAKSNAVDVLVGVALVAATIIEIDNMIKCNEGERQYCDYRDSNRCEYQTVYRDDIRTSCRQYGRYSTYDCVTTRSTGTMYIKSCHGFHNRY